MNNADQVIVLNIVMSFEQWIEGNVLRMAQEPECSINEFPKRMLRLNKKLSQQVDVAFMRLIAGGNILSYSPFLSA